MSTVTEIMPTYGRLPIAFERGQGACLYDADGNRYVDALAGIAVVGLGHAHPAVTQAIQRQAETLVHTSNLYEIPLQEQLARRLCEISGMENAFFANSGAEENEAALKIARLYGNEGGMAHKDVMRSIELLGKEVIPALHEVKLQPYESKGRAGLLSNGSGAAGVAP